MLDDFLLTVFDELYDRPIQLDTKFLAYLIYMKLYEGEEAHAYLLVAEA